MPVKNTLLLAGGLLLLLLNLCHASVPLTPSEKEKVYALADSMHFDHDIIEILDGYISGKFTRFMGKIPKDALAFTTTSKWSFSQLLLLNANFKKLGYQFFWVPKPHESTLPDMFIVIKSTDQFDILRLQGTYSQRNYLTTDRIISTLQQWHKSASFDIIGANGSRIEAHFSLLPADLKAFVREENRLCPDIMNEEGITPKEMERRHIASPYFSLWWTGNDNKYPARLLHAIIIFFICTLLVISLICRRN